MSTSLDESRHNITTSPRGATALAGKAFVEGGNPSYITAFRTDSTVQSVELWNVEANDDVSLVNGMGVGNYGPDWEPQPGALL